MSELKATTVYDAYWKANSVGEGTGVLVYPKSEADKVIAEKDKEIAELKKKLMPCLNGDCILTCEVVEKYGKENAELKQKLENVQASMYCDVVDANMDNRRLRRALWIARANRALDKIAWFKLWNSSISTMNPEDGARQEFDKWKKNLGKFLKKAEEYK